MLFGSREHPPCWPGSPRLQAGALVPGGAVALAGVGAHAANAGTVVAVTAQKSPRLKKLSSECYGSRVPVTPQWPRIHPGHHPRQTVQCISAASPQLPSHPWPQRRHSLKNKGLLHSSGNSWPSQALCSQRCCLGYFSQSEKKQSPTLEISIPAMAARGLQRGLAGPCRAERAGGAEGSSRQRFAPRTEMPGVWQVFRESWTLWMTRCRDSQHGPC